MLNTAHLLRIDLNLLVFFQVVLEERHVGRAAVRLNLTPSAVSHGLRRLRILFNDPLFLRTPKGVVPTARALALSKDVSQILASVEGVLSSAVPFDPATSRRRFVVGGPDAVLASTAIPLMQRISVGAPHIDIGLMHVMPIRPQSAKDNPWAGCLTKLEKREIDVAMLPVRTLPARFEGRTLYQEDFVVAMRNGHPFARAPGIAAFCASQHLLVSFSSDPHGFVDELLEKQGRKRRIVLTVPSFMMALAPIANSDLLAVLPRRLVQQYAGHYGLAWAELPLRRKPDPIRAVATKAALVDAGIAWFTRILCDVFMTGRHHDADA